MVAHKHGDKLKRKEQMNAFRLFLQRMERTGKSFTAEDIASATTYQLNGTVKTNLGKPVWRHVVQRVGPNEYKAINTLDLDEKAFADRISVNRLLEEPITAIAPHTLSERLFAKAQENFVLALELYNRPSLLNRLESFAMLHCTAWEQLLKGKLIHDRGDAFIFRKDGRTKGLTECCEAEFKKPSHRIWKNIDAIADLRNMSTHLIMPELGVAYSPLFQAGVVNFLKTYKVWTGREPLPAHAVGLLTLTTGAKAPSAIDLSMKYGKELGEQVAAIIDQVTFKIEADLHPEFAIVVKHKTVFGSGPDVDFTMDQLMAMDGKVAIIEKSRDTTNDMLPGHVVAEVNAMMKAQLPEEALIDIFSYNGKPNNEMNKSDFTVLCEDQKWNKANNEYHNYNVPLKRSTYTIKCVHWIVDKLKNQNDYLRKRKESYYARLKAARKSK